MPLCFKFALELGSEKAKENREGLQKKRTHQLLVCEGDDNLFGENVKCQ
jgi:hypothetical protein